MELVRVRPSSSSSLTDCRDRNEPKILEGRPDFCKLRGLDLGEKRRSMLLLELDRSRVGFEWTEVGLEDGSVVKKEAGRRFLRVAEVGTGMSSSSIGVRAFIGGRNMLKLFRRRRSVIVGRFCKRCSEMEQKMELKIQKKQSHDAGCCAVCSASSRHVSPALFWLLFYMG